MEPSSTKVYFVHSKDLNSSNSYYKQRPDLTTSSRKLSTMTGCLEIIEGEDSGQSKISWDSPNYSRPSSATGDRPWSRGSIGCCPPRTDSSMSRRMNTPTKQVSLQAVRRKEESTEPFVDQVDWQPLALENKRKIKDPETNLGYSERTEPLVQGDSFRLEAVETSWQPTEQVLLEARKMAGEATPQAETCCEDSIVKTAQESEIHSGGKTIDEKHGDDSDDDGDDDDDSDSSEEEEEKLRAPNELLMEFVDCLMRKDFQNASKLCKMILLYEPENPEALKFQPLIEEKLIFDAEAEKVATDSSDNDESDDESDNEDEDSSDDSEDGDGDSCSDADSSDEDNDGNDDDDCDGGNKESGSNINNNKNNSMSRNERSCYHRHLN